MVKCWTLIINRNRARLFKRGSYEANLGKAKAFGKTVQYRIPDGSIPIEVEAGRGSVPLWVVNEKTLVALTIRPKEDKASEGSVRLQTEEAPEEKGKEYIEIVEKTDTDAHTKLNLLIKREFWKQVALKIKLSLVETLIYLAAGYGIIRFAEYILISLFGGGG